ncbi:hypothetical protein [Mesorhizobium sp. CO1-1-8]|uniref:hypothetical protein n=1 Tax=Mesorhizobium sp. CO1-1-8 TaxID=2876631 RepID=UPI001CD12D33|nr:hypothetical protein [Mesorhizobium sp. CO1-1-8]MBZ9772266.1 hypothetical protein [Mesorhizobium sp. CO1-1-8]
MNRRIQAIFTLASTPIDQSGIIRFADIRPDWLARTEPADIVAAVREITSRAAA